MTVTYRTAGAWGSGKGANLTAAEVDGNFYDHEQRIEDLEAGTAGSGDNPLVDVTVSGATLTKYYADSTTGTEVLSAPFAPPVVTVSGTTHTVLSTNIGAYHRCTNAAGCTVTVPDSTSFAVASEWHFRQAPGSAFVTFVTPSGVTINGVDGFDLGTDTEGATCTLKLVDTNEYDLFGLLAVTP